MDDRLIQAATAVRFGINHLTNVLAREPYDILEAADLPSTTTTHSQEDALFVMEKLREALFSLLQARDALVEVGAFKKQKRGSP